jgi:hypothetical protein
MPWLHCPPVREILLETLAYSSSTDTVCGFQCQLRPNLDLVISMAWCRMRGRTGAAWLLTGREPSLEP